MSKIYTEEKNRQWLKSLPKKVVSVKVIVKSDKGNVLLVKPNYKNTWQMPGGAVDAQEDPIEAASRESKEELNLDIDPRDLRIADVIFRKDVDMLCVVYEYNKIVNESADYSVDDEEIEEYRFVATKDVANILPDYYKAFWQNFIS